MTIHQSSVLTVVAIVATVAVTIVGYGLGRTHAAWLVARAARRDVPELRRIAWARTRGVLGGLALLITVVAVAITDLAR